MAAASWFEQPVSSRWGTSEDIPTVEQALAELASRALSTTGGNHAAAARLIGMDPRTLRRHLAARDSGENSRTCGSIDDA